MVEQLLQQNANKSFIETQKGEARFWKAIDDSFDHKQIEKVQRHVGDSEPLEFQLRKGKAELVKDSNGIVVDILPK